jgi:hypothetical protein
MAKPRTKTLLTISAIFCFLVWFVWFDQNNIDRDFARLKDMIRETNQKAWLSKNSYELNFEKNKAVIINRITGKEERKLRIPTFYQINYETIEGTGKIIFTGHGTGSHNVLLHGGEIILKSWFGRERTLWIHCTGFVTEGKMTDRSPQ